MFREYLPLMTHPKIGPEMGVTTWARPVPQRGSILGELTRRRLYLGYANYQKCGNGVWGPGSTPQGCPNPKLIFHNVNKGCRERFLTHRNILLMVRGGSNLTNGSSLRKSHIFASCGAVCGDRELCRVPKLVGNHDNQR